MAREQIPNLFFIATLTYYERSLACVNAEPATAGIFSPAQNHQDTSNLLSHLLIFLFIICIITRARKRAG